MLYRHVTQSEDDLLQEQQDTHSQIYVIILYRCLTKLLSKTQRKIIDFPTVDLNFSKHSELDDTIETQGFVYCNKKVMFGYSSSQLICCFFVCLDYINDLNYIYVGP